MMLAMDKIHASKSNINTWTVWTTCWKKYTDEIINESCTRPVLPLFHIAQRDINPENILLITFWTQSETDNMIPSWRQNTWYHHIKQINNRSTPADLGLVTPIFSHDDHFTDYKISFNLILGNKLAVVILTSLLRIISATPYNFFTVPFPTENGV
jgi:hypothetical protein